MHIDNCIKEKRTEGSNRLTQQELADRVGVTRQTIIALEKGEYNPSLLLALQLSKTLNSSVDELFHLVDK